MYSCVMHVHCFFNDVCKFFSIVQCGRCIVGLDVDCGHTSTSCVACTSLRAPFGSFAPLLVRVLPPSPLPVTLQFEMILLVIHSFLARQVPCPAVSHGFSRKPHMRRGAQPEPHPFLLFHRCCTACVGDGRRQSCTALLCEPTVNSCMCCNAAAAYEPATRSLHARKRVHDADLRAAGALCVGAVAAFWHPPPVRSAAQATMSSAILTCARAMSKGGNGWGWLRGNGASRTQLRFWIQSNCVGHTS